MTEPTPAPRSKPRRRHVLQTAAAAASLALVGRQVSAQAPAADLSGLLAARLAHQGVGLGAARIAGERVDHAFAGRRTPASDRAITEADRFEIGSVTKTFVALLLAQRVLAGQLKLDDAVEAALPAGTRLRDSTGAPLRWVDLATHRSGLPRLPDNMQPVDPTDPYADYGEDDLLDFLRRWQPTRPRDSGFEYSNLGFGLLGHALAAQAGVELETLLRREVLAPLGIEGITVAHTGQAADSTLLPGHDASGKRVPPWHFDAMVGAGGLRARLSDMVRYARCAADAAPNPLREAFALTMTPRADGPAPGTRIGLGWMITAAGGRTLAHHDGGTFGFASSVFVDRAARRAGVALANAAVPLDDLARHLLDPAFPLRDLAAEARAAAAATQAPALALPAQALAPLAGVYALNAQFKVTVTADGTRLFAQATGQGAFELFARGPRQFFARVTPLQITFEGETGPPPAFELQQGGQRLRFVRETGR